MHVWNLCEKLSKSLQNPRKFCIISTRNSRRLTIPKRCEWQKSQPEMEHEKQKFLSRFMSHFSVQMILDLFQYFLQPNSTQLPVITEYLLLRQLPAFEMESDIKLIMQNVIKRLPNGIIKFLLRDDFHFTLKTFSFGLTVALMNKVCPRNEWYFFVTPAKSFCFNFSFA